MKPTPKAYSPKTREGARKAIRTERMVEKTIRVIIYARVSSQKQLENKEEDSIKSQIKNCMRFAKHANRTNERWEVVDTIADDGRTGRNDKRAGIQKVKELIRSGAAEVVLVNRLSRAFRNSRLAMEFDEFLHEFGARMVSRMEPSGTDTSSDKIARRIHYIFDEGRSDSISEDVIRSIESRAEAGLTHGGVPRPGYDSKNGRLLKVEQDAAVVEEIFEMAVAGMTPMEIVNDLNIRKVRTRQRTSKGGKVTGGKRFRIENILTILRDPIYKGTIVYNGEEYPSAADSIISEEVWDKVQVTLAGRPKKKEPIIQERDKNFMPLKGKIRCGCCNSAMKPSFSTKRKTDGSMEKYFYYLCSKHEKQGDESTCKIGRVPARLLESLLMTAFGEIAANPKVAERLIQKAPKAKTTRIRELTKDRQAIRRQLKDLDSEVKAVTKKILQFAGTAVGDEIEKQVETLTQRKNDLITEEIHLNREIDALKSDILAPKKLQHALAHFAEAAKCLSEDEQRELYKLLFKSVIISEGGRTKDPASENARRPRDSRRLLSIEVRLRSEAVETLFGEVPSTGSRKSGFTIPLEIAHCRKKPMENCAILSPVHKECGHKGPRTRKRPKKTEHEIHRAIRWKKEMEELGIDQKSLAKNLGCSKAAITHVMNWLKLSNGAQKILLQLSDPNQVRSISRKARNLILEEQSESAQVKKIEEMISEKQ